jgi:diacylglycerol kinase (ATP)
MKARVIVNPVAARGNWRQTWAQIEAVWRAENFAFESVFTAGRGHATVLARTAMCEGCTLIVAAGGDGTINEVINGMVSEETPQPNLVLGLLPCGTGNDFARAVGIPNNPLEAARHLARVGAIRTVDAVEARFQTAAGPARRYFINVASLGFAAEVVERLERQGKRMGGTLPYLSALLTTVMSFRNKPATYSVDNRCRQSLVNSIVIANGPYFGGGMFVAPHARLDDHRLDLIVVGNLSARQFLWHTPKLYRGTHLKIREVDESHCQSLIVESPQRLPLQADGELLGEAPASFHILPGCLRIRA